MENFLSYEERKPLSYAMMKKHAPSWCAVRLYDGLNKYSSLKSAAGSKPCMIVLYELHEREETEVGHYSLVILGDKPRYWSSYGFDVEKEIALELQGHSERPARRPCERQSAVSTERTHRDVLEVVSPTGNCTQNA